MADKETSWLIKLIDKVTGPMNKIQKAVRSSTAAVDRLQASNQKLQSSFSGIGRTIAGLGLGLSLTMLTQESMAFEKGMALVNTVMKATPEELAKVSDEVRELSKVMAIPRAQLTAGLNSVVQAGVPAADAMQFLTDSTKAAIGGQADLTTVIETTAGVLSTYGMGFDQAASLQNKMQKAVDIGMMTMQEFAGALPNVTTLASSLGISIDEVTGAFAGMTGKTGGAAEVSTQLASIMSGLINPTQQAMKAAEQLGITFDAMSVKRAGGLSNFLNDLMPRIDALSKKTGQTKEGIIAQLFGRKEAIVGVLAMTGNLKDAVTDATEAMRNSAGAVDYAFGEMNNTVSAKLTKLMNTIYAAWDKLYDKVKPVIGSIIDGIASAIDWIVDFAKKYPFIVKIAAGIALIEVAMIAMTFATGAATTAWTWLMTAMSSSALAKVSGMIVTLGARVLGLQAPFWAATSSTWALNAALTANPIGIIILAIAGLVGWIVLAVKRNEQWGTSLKALASGPFGTVIYAIDLVRKSWENVKKAFSAEGITGALREIKYALVKEILGPIETIIEVWAKLSGSDLAKNALEAIKHGRAVLGGDVVAEEVSGRANIAGAIGNVYAQMNAGGGDTTKDKTLTTSGGSTPTGMDATGGTKGAAIINIKNTFNIDVDGAEDPQQFIDKVMMLLTDQLSDGIIAASR